MEPREKGFLSPGGTGEGKAGLLHGKMSVLKPGERGHREIRIQKAACQELGLEEAKAQLRKCGSELRVRVARRERRNRCHGVSVKMM